MHEWANPFMTVGPSHPSHLSTVPTRTFLHKTMLSAKEIWGLINVQTIIDLSFQTNDRIRILVCRFGRVIKLRRAEE